MALLFVCLGVTFFWVMRTLGLEATSGEAACSLFLVCQLLVLARRNAKQSLPGALCRVSPRPPLYPGNTASWLLRTQGRPWLQG